MSKKEPTDRQLVMWWMHQSHWPTATMIPLFGLWPISWEDVQERVEHAFDVRMGYKRCERIRRKIREEIDRLAIFYEKKARVLL